MTLVTRLYLTMPLNKGGVIFSAKLLSPAWDGYIIMLDYSYITEQI